MAKRGTRKCIICGKEYVYCPNCGNGDKDETWRYLYDAERCMNIFNVLSDYLHERINKEDAKTQLKELKVSKDSVFNDEIQKQINEIMKTEKAHKNEEAQIVKED